MQFEEKKTHANQLIYTKTDEMLKSLVDLYNDRQKQEFGSKAKKVKKIAIIHNLVEMKLREEMAQIREGNGITPPIRSNDTYGEK
ncbi:hypothetical protein pA_gene0032 [Vibrio phage 13VT501A]|nr:hypothetical protein pA_gene0032 [Vibrio phage 13VT501A]